MSDPKINRMVKKNAPGSRKGPPRKCKGDHSNSASGSISASSWDIIERRHSLSLAVSNNPFVSLLDRDPGYDVVSFLTAGDFRACCVAAGYESAMRCPLRSLGDGSDAFHLIMQRREAGEVQASEGFAMAYLNRRRERGIGREDVRGKFLEGIELFSELVIGHLSLKEEFDATGGDWKDIGAETNNRQTFDYNGDAYQPPSYYCAKDFWARATPELNSDEYTSLSWSKKQELKNALWKLVSDDLEKLLKWTAMEKQNKIRSELMGKRMRIGALDGLKSPLSLSSLVRFASLLGFHNTYTSNSRLSVGLFEEVGATLTEFGALLSLPEGMLCQSQSLRPSWGRILFLSTEESLHEWARQGACECCSTTSLVMLHIQRLYVFTPRGDVVPLLSTGYITPDDGEEYEEMPDEGEMLDIAAEVHKENILDLERRLFGNNLPNGQIGSLLAHLTNITSQTFKRYIIPMTAFFEMLDKHDNGKGITAAAKDAVLPSYLQQGCVQGSDEEAEFFESFLDMDMSESSKVKFGTGAMRKLGTSELSLEGIATVDELRSRFCSGPDSPYQTSHKIFFHRPSAAATATSVLEGKLKENPNPNREDERENLIKKKTADIKSIKKAVEGWEDLVESCSCKSEPFLLRNPNGGYGMYEEEDDY